MIDFKNKRIVFTGYNFKFRPMERSEDWTVEDELMSLSLYIQMQLIAKKNDINNVGFYEWQEKIEETAIETANKSYLTGNGVIQSGHYDQMPEYKPINETSFEFQAFALDYMGRYINSEEGEKQKEEDEKHAKAVAVAKRQLELEQQEEEELRLEEAQQETNQIVFPLKNYGK